MSSNRHLVGKRVAQALVALALVLIVIQGASAAEACDCPACATHACMQMGCPNGDDGATCASTTPDTCRYGILMPVLSLAERAIASHFATIITAVWTSGGTPACNTATLRCALSPPITAPPAHIAFCRLRR